MSQQEEIVSGLILELRRGTIVLSVLSQLSKPLYGYSLVQRLNECNVPVEANTLYPLLRRLEKQELLKSEWETSGTIPRKYYITTELGNKVYEELRSHWANMVKEMNRLMDLEDDKDDKEEL